MLVVQGVDPLLDSCGSELSHPTAKAGEQICLVGWRKGQAEVLE